MLKFIKQNKEVQVLAYANVILDKQFMIRGITLIEKDGRKFISMPSRRVLNGDRNFRDTAHPLNRKIRKDLTDAIFEAYEEFLESEE